MTVAPAIRPKLYRAEDLDHLCREGYTHALIDGVLFEMPLPGARHGRHAYTITIHAGMFAEERNLGEGFAAETGFLLQCDPDTVLGADWAFVTHARLPKLMPPGPLALAPDLVLEVRSPSDRAVPYERKIQLWLQHGVRLVWAVDPVAQTLTVHRSGADPVVLTAADILSGEEVLPGFSLPLSRVFR